MGDARIPRLGFLLSHGEASEATLDDEGIEVCISGPALRIDQEQLSYRAVGDELLRSVQHITVALLGRRGAHRKNLRPRAWLGRGQAGD